MNKVNSCNKRGCSCSKLPPDTEWVPMDMELGSTQYYPALKLTYIRQVGGNLVCENGECKVIPEDKFKDMNLQEIAALRDDERNDAIQRQLYMSRNRNDSYRQERARLYKEHLMRKSDAEIDPVPLEPESHIVLNKFAAGTYLGGNIKFFPIKTKDKLVGEYEVGKSCCLIRVHHAVKASDGYVHSVYIVNIAEFPYIQAEFFNYGLLYKHASAFPTKPDDGVVVPENTEKLSAGDKSDMIKLIMRLIYLIQTEDDPSVNETRRMMIHRFEYDIATGNLIPDIENHRALFEATEPSEPMFIYDEEVGELEKPLSLFEKIRRLSSAS